MPTIIIVTYERLELTQRCIESVLNNTSPPIKLVIVDNCSRNEVKNYLVKVPGVKIFLDKNLGLYKALNYGIRMIDEELIAFLDCDIIVTRGWIEALTHEININNNIGLVGSRYFNPDGTLQEGYPVLNENGWYGENHIDKLESADCQYIAIGCSLFKRSAWQKVGGFDENYFISHGDIDFCFKLRYEAKLRVRYCPESTVIHDHNSRLEKNYEKLRFNSEICNKDYSLFKQKWEKKYKLEINSFNK